MSKQSLRVSFEFFPPKTEKGTTKLNAVQATLADKKPTFFSVTYGAGGSTRDRTINTVIDTATRTNIPVAPHLSCIGQSREEIIELITHYKNNNIERIVALRGDLPSGMGSSIAGIGYASDLVKLIRENTGDHFHLEVAAYPEVHPQAASADSDFKYFIEKAQAGANSAITQYFYNAGAYYEFKNRCEKAGVNIPIIPGIMPITNYTNLIRFSDMCGAEIPRWIKKRLESYGDDLESIQQFGTEAVSQLCQELINMDCPGLHFYTLNQAEPSLAICDALSL